MVRTRSRYGSSDRRSHIQAFSPVTHSGSEVVPLTLLSQYQATASFLVRRSAFIPTQYRAPPTAFAFLPVERSKAAFQQVWRSVSIRANRSFSTFSFSASRAVFKLSQSPHLIWSSRHLSGRPIVFRRRFQRQNLGKLSAMLALFPRLNRISSIAGFGGFSLAISSYFMTAWRARDRCQLYIRTPRQHGARRKNQKQFHSCDLFASPV